MKVIYFTNERQQGKLYSLSQVNVKKKMKEENLYELTRKLPLATFINIIIDDLFVISLVLDCKQSFDDEN